MTSNGPWRMEQLIPVTGTMALLSHSLQVQKRLLLPARAGAEANRCSPNNSDNLGETPVKTLMHRTQRF